jgi:hypothetical protein
MRLQTIGLLHSMQVFDKYNDTSLVGSLVRSFFTRTSIHFVPLDSFLHAAGQCAHTSALSTIAPTRQGLVETFVKVIHYSLDRASLLYGTGSEARVL